MATCFFKRFVTVERIFLVCANYSVLNTT